MTGSARAIPIRIVGRRFWLWGLVFTLIGVVLVTASPWKGFADFPQFWSAGRTVATPDLLDPVRHELWQLANGVHPGFFAYPPGAAWLFAPFGVSTIEVGYWLHAAVMTGLAAVGGLVGARVYELDRRVALVVVFAWAPTLVSVAFGQNVPLALLLAFLTIEGLSRNDDLFAGLAVGLLLYKPTLAIPLLGLMVLRYRWRALAVAAAAAVAWYLAGVAAAAGDWSWPAHWFAGLGGYYAADAPSNAARSISLPGLLVGYGLPVSVAWAAAIAVVGLALPRLRRAPIVEAGAAACLVGLVVSPHSLDYEAMMMLPAIMWSLGRTTTGISEPARTRLFVAAYVVAQLLLISTAFAVSSLTVAAFVATAIWISGWRRTDVDWDGPPLPTA